MDVVVGAQCRVDDVEICAQDAVGVQSGDRGDAFLQRFEQRFGIGFGCGRIEPGLEQADESARDAGMCTEHSRDMRPAIREFALPQVVRKGAQHDHLTVVEACRAAPIR